MDPEHDIRILLESHLVKVSIATTGELSDLSALGNQYKRTTGSFIDDGFVVGDAIHASGFTGTANGLADVTAVAALSLTVDRALPTVTAGGTRTIYAGLPAISFPAQPFTVPSDKPWVRARVRSASQRVVAVADTNIQRHTGVFLVDVFEPYSMGGGLNRLERLAAAIRAQFRITTSIVGQNLTVRVMGMDPGSLLENPDSLQMPVSASWWADVAGL